MSATSAEQALEKQSQITRTQRERTYGELEHADDVAPDMVATEYDSCGQLDEQAFVNNTELNYIKQRNDTVKDFDGERESSTLLQTNSVRYLLPLAVCENSFEQRSVESSNGENKLTNSVSNNTSEQGVALDEPSQSAGAISSRVQNTDSCIAVTDSSINIAAAADSLTNATAVTDSSTAAIDSVVTVTENATTVTDSSTAAIESSTAATDSFTAARDSSRAITDSYIATTDSSVDNAAATDSSDELRSHKDSTDYEYDPALDH